MSSAQPSLVSTPAAASPVESADRLVHSYAVCRAITAEHARTFFYASPLLPPAKRRAAFAVYAFCRTSDDAVDRYTPESHRTLEELLTEQRRGLDQAYQFGEANPPPLNELIDALPWVPALADTVRRFGIPRWIFDDLLDGVRMDVSVSTYTDFDALLEYCHKVAGVVGLMMTHIFGFEAPWVLRHAAAMGVGMQLTNIARDVADDARLGRVYLPQTWLHEHGLTSQDVLAWATQPAAAAARADRLQPVMRRLIDTARLYFQYSLAGVPGLTDPLGRCCTLAMGRVYADILLALEAQHADPFAGRAHRTGPQKLARIGQILASPKHWLARRPAVWHVWPEPATPPPMYWPK